MKHITIDCSQITGRQHLHRLLAEVLEFPDWYGHNLDALYDCLTDAPPVQLVLTHFDTLEACLGNYTDAFIQTLSDAATENPDFCYCVETSLMETPQAHRG